MSDRYGKRKLKLMYQFDVNLALLIAVEDQRKKPFDETKTKAPLIDMT